MTTTLTPVDNSIRYVHPTKEQRLRQETDRWLLALAQHGIAPHWRNVDKRPMEEPGLDCYVEINYHPRFGTVDVVYHARGHRFYTDRGLGARQIERIARNIARWGWRYEVRCSRPPTSFAFNRRVVGHVSLLGAQRLMAAELADETARWPKVELWRGEERLSEVDRDPQDVWSDA